jgi:hypothetical protein
MVWWRCRLVLFWGLERSRWRSPESKDCWTIGGRRDGKIMRPGKESDICRCSNIEMKRELVIYCRIRNQNGGVILCEFLWGRTRETFMS